MALLFLSLIQNVFALSNSIPLTPPPTVYSTTDSIICENALPLLWNGTVISAAGSYTVTLVSSTNEDSLATLNLTVNPVYLSIFNLTVCENQLPFEIFGLTFNGTDSQTAVYTSVMNCDSLVKVNISVIPYIPFSIDSTICATEVPFTWNGLTFTESGSQMVILTSPNNCDIGATLNLTVLPILSSTTSLSICTDQLPFSWNGLTFNASGSQTATLTSSNNCDSLATLNLTVVPNFTSTSTVAICSSQLPYAWNGLTFYTPGTQTANLTSASGCDSNVTLTLIVNSPTYSFSFDNICADELPYSWNGLTFTNAGTQSVTLVNSAGCDSIATFSLTVNPNTYTYNFLSICESELPYVWNGLTFTETSEQTAILTNSFGCNYYATLDLVVRPILYSTTDLTICETQLPYTWNGFTLTEAGSQTAVLVSSINCDSVATLNLSVSPTLSSTTDITICETQLPFSWNGLNFTTSGSQTATLVSAVNCDSLATLNLTVNPTLTSQKDSTICSYDLPFTWNGLVFNESGSQSASFTSVTGCDSIATLTLTVNPVPQAPVVSESQTYCDVQIINPISATASLGGELTWYSDENLTEVIGTGNVLTPEFYIGELNYYVVETAEGCVGLVGNTSITIENCPTTIPTAFTPDNDGMNDTWQITSIDINYPKAFIQIYNRWGSLLFEHQSSLSNPYNSNAWNGTYQGQDLPVSSYYYVVNYNDEKGTPPLKGTVSIIRN